MGNRKSDKNYRERNNERRKYLARLRYRKKKEAEGKTVRRYSRFEEYEEAPPLAPAKKGRPPGVKETKPRKPKVQRKKNPLKTGPKPFRTEEEKKALRLFHTRLRYWRRKGLSEQEAKDRAKTPTGRGVPCKTEEEGVRRRKESQARHRRKKAKNENQYKDWSEEKKQRHRDLNKKYRDKKQCQRATKLSSKRTPQKKVNKSRNFLNNKDMLQAVIESKAQGKMNDTLAKMLMMLTKRYAKSANFRGYSFREDMESHALLQVMETWNRFDETRFSNPFAFYTQCIKNSFKQFLNKEKRQREIGDILLVEQRMAPSMTYIEENSGELYAKLRFYGESADINKFDREKRQVDRFRDD